MSSDGQGLLSHIHFRSATALVVANVIGAGVFTTTGFQAADLGNPMIILALWLLGGVLAYCGALCFAELGAAMPDAGGEYIYLRETNGRAFGFMSAFVSLLAGFSAPIAAAVKSLVLYLRAFFPVLESDPAVLGALHLTDLVALIFVWLLVGVHLRGRKGAIGFNDLITLLKIAGIVLIIVAAALFGKGDTANFVQVAGFYAVMSTSALFSALATSLMFVMVCYSGWNAAAYVASEIVEPQKTLPKALLAGTTIVTVLYLLLNMVYFYGADVEQDVMKFRALTRTNRGGAPINALLLQGLVTSLIIMSGSVDQILSYAGFTLALMSALAVSCVLVLRVKKPDMPRPFRVWAYPFPPLFIMLVSLWTMYWAFQGRPVESTLALLTVAMGGGIFYGAALLRR
ncbi:MAG: amino acid permease [Gammaproteobacteria bacterium]